jgi:Dolichyl-phosphate-mannose-protein mannosyltransferase
MPTHASKLTVSRRQIGIVVLVLLALMAIRITQISLSYREFHIDEVWSIWQLIGSHTDYNRQMNWPPTYSAILDGWRHLVGIDPIPLRFLSLLFMIVGDVCLYRAVRRVANSSAGLLAILGYSGLAVNQYLSGQVRDYALALALLPVVFWLTLRYFDHPRPRRGIVLGLAMAAMFYTAYASAVAFFLLGLYTLIVYQWRAWHWWLPGVVGGLLAVPQIISIAGEAKTWTTAARPPVSPDFLGPVVGLFTNYTGSSGLAWIVLFVLATLFSLLAFLSRRKLSLPALALLIWTLSPFLFYALNRYLSLFSSPTYTWFVTLGLVAWVAYGLSLLPSVGPLLAGLTLLAIMATPFNPEPISVQALPLGLSFQWLAKNIKWGDVIVVDPLWKDRYCNCIQPEAFDYFSRLYFPQGLQIVTDPTGYRRVWYVKWDSLQDKDFEARVRQGRVEGPFVGPPEALFRLYEAPPDPTGIAFSNGLRFLGADVPDESTNLLVARDADTIRLRLWWAVDKPLSHDYSVSLQVLYAGSLALQSDSPPNVIIPEAGPRQTSQWQVGQLYVEQRDIDIPKHFLPTGPYPIYLIVYDSQTGERLSAPGANADGALPIYTLNMKAW